VLAYRYDKQKDFYVNLRIFMVYSIDFLLRRYYNDEYFIFGDKNMAETLFTVPDIYPDFACKISSCRQSCCKGWEITVSMTDYFKLVGMNCPRALRRRLDGSLCIIDRPSAERYAAFAKTFDGDCPMHDADGFCALQRSCGERAQSAVCRYYPRSPRTAHGYECALSASCEAVTELLFARKEPLGFIRVPLSFDFPLPAPRSGAITENYEKVRRLFISVMQNREVPTGARNAAAGRIAQTLDAPFLSCDRKEITRALDSVSGKPEYPTLTSPDEKALGIAAELLDCFEERHAIYDYAEEAKRNLRIGGNGAVLPSAYIDACRQFDVVFQEWDRMLEQVLVNHIFYEGFPFADDKESIYASWASLCALYAFFRLTAVGYTLTHSDVNALADMTAAAFRLIENSNFDLRAAAMLAAEDYSDFDSLASLLNL
jgi:hypothetical protein